MRRHIQIIVGAGMMGNEYGWNTLRTLVARARSRTSLLTAKFVALFLYAVVFSIVLAGLFGALSVVSSVIVGIDVGFSRDALVDMISYAIRTIVANLPYLAFAFMLATIARSNAAGVAGALEFNLIEPTVFALLGPLWAPFRDVQRGRLSYNTERLLFDGVDGNWVPLGVIALYTVVFGRLSYYVFLRRDVTSG